MKIGLDLDHTVYGFPEFFRAFIPAMAAAGHTFYCTSNHKRSSWEPRHVPNLRKLGIDPDLIDPSLMHETQQFLKGGGPQNKARMADCCDVVFDDHARHFQNLTKTPIFETPGDKAAASPRIRRAA